MSHNYFYERTAKHFSDTVVLEAHFSDTGVLDFSDTVVLEAQSNLRGGIAHLRFAEFFAHVMTPPQPVPMRVRGKKNAIRFF
jgi:hypothetical protein